MKPPSHSAPAAHPSLLASLRLGRLILAVPLSDLRSLEAVLDVDEMNRDSRSAGTIDWQTGRCRVFCVDERLAMQRAITPENRVCAILAGGEWGDFGLLCSAVEPVDSENLATYCVPASMRTHGSPLEGLTLHGKRVLCRTTGAMLARFLLAVPAAAVMDEQYA